MGKGCLRACGLAAALVACCATPAFAAGEGLNVYTVEATGQNLRTLAQAGFDVTEGRDSGKNTVEVVGSQRQIDATKVDATKVRSGGTPARLAPADSQKDAV